MRSLDNKKIALCQFSYNMDSNRIWCNQIGRQKQHKCHCHNPQFGPENKINVDSTNKVQINSVLM